MISSTELSRSAANDAWAVGTIINNGRKAADRTLGRRAGEYRTWRKPSDTPLMTILASEEQRFRRMRHTTKGEMYAKSATLLHLFHQYGLTTKRAQIAVLLQPFVRAYHMPAYRFKWIDEHAADHRGL